MRSARVRFVVAALASLSFASFAAPARGETPPPFDEVSLVTVPAGARSEDGRSLSTTVRVTGKGDVKVELIEQPSKVLGSATGKATSEEVGELAKALDAARKAPRPPAGGGYDLAWSVKGSAGEIRTCMPAHESESKEPLFVLGDRLRAIQAAIFFGPILYRNDPLSAKARTIEGVIEAKGDQVFVRHEKHGRILVRDTKRSGSLAHHLKASDGEQARLIGRLKITKNGLALDVEAVEARTARKTELYMGMTPAGFPYSVSLEKGTIIRVRAIVADADGNDYDSVDVAGGLQGAILRPHVKFVPTPTPGLAGAVTPR